MDFLKEKKLYRIEITKSCPAINAISGKSYLPSSDSVKEGAFGSIPVGTRGWVIEKFNKKYFTPDEDQEGLDLYTPADQPNILIPYRKIEGAYKIIWGINMGK